MIYFLAKISIANHCVSSCDWSGQDITVPKKIREHPAADGITHEVFGRCVGNVQ